MSPLLISTPQVTERRSPCKQTVEPKSVPRISRLPPSQLPQSSRKFPDECSCLVLRCILHVPSFTSHFSRALPDAQELKAGWTFWEHSPARSGADWVSPG